ncbi:MAG: rhodanese-like domain-containing protein [Thermoanaerobacterales bacterium]|nr:rhodanese-like domain-containing protein [Thermoanaerobacterales bacterium]
MTMNNAQKALLAVGLAIVLFLGLATGFHWTGVGAAGGVSVSDAVVQYYERMPDDIYKIPVPDLKAALDAGGKGLYIVDIREHKDFVQGHIPGAHNIPFKEVGRRLNELPRNQRIIVYCYTGQTGGQTVAALTIAGFDARSLNGGMNNGWAAANLPTEAGE